MNDWPLEDERVLIADACAHSFWLFLKYGFGVALNTELGGWLQETGPYNHRDLCDWLQSHTWEKWGKPRLEGKRLRARKKLMVVIPRHHGKTVINKALQMWLSLHLTDLSILNGSYSADKSQKVLAAIKALYQGSDGFGLFAWLYGVWHNPDRKWTDAALVHGARRGMGRSEPSLYTCSIETGATGDHPDMYVPDDLISGDKIKEDSEAHMRQANYHMVRMIPVVNPGGLIMLLGTRYSDGDVIGEAIWREGVKSISGMEPSDNRIQVDRGGAWDMYYLEADLGDDEEGYPIPAMPNCVSREDLKAWRDRDPKEYAAQAKNRPDVGGHQPLTREIISEATVQKLPDPNDCILTLHMDTAFRDGKRSARSDWSVIVVFAHYLDGSGHVMFVDGVGSRHWKSDQFYNKLYDMVQHWTRKRYRIRGMTDETEVGGKAGSADQMIRNKFVERNAKVQDPVRRPPFLPINRLTGPKKRNRILDAAGYWQSGHVFLWKHARGYAELTDQMLRVGMTRHDDWADAAADVFSDEVYRHARSEIKRLRGDWPLRKGDDVLTEEGGRISDAEACLLYDKHDRDSRGLGRKAWTREPIG